MKYRLIFTLCFVALLGLCTALIIPRWWVLSTRAAPTIVPAERVEAALAWLDELTIVTEMPGGSYDRSYFGGGWLDLDGNGCDTRVDVVSSWMVMGNTKAEGAAPTPQGGARCTIPEGVFLDPYTGYSHHVRGELAIGDVHLDHVVPLADAWHKGAWQWSREEAWQFANDPANLIPTTAAVNIDKGSQDAAAWLPPHDGYHCAYVVTQVEVKHRYRLGVSAAEWGALSAVLSGC